LEASGIKVISGGIVEHFLTSVIAMGVCQKGFSLKYADCFSIFHSVIVLLPSILDHPLKPLHPLRKYRNDDFSVDFAEYLTDCALESLLVRQMHALELSPEKTKGEEVTRGALWTISWLHHPLGFCAVETVIGLARIVRTCIVQMDMKTFQ
jgi:hypothetical protein